MRWNKCTPFWCQSCFLEIRNDKLFYNEIPLQSIIHFLKIQFQDHVAGVTFHLSSNWMTSLRIKTLSIAFLHGIKLAWNGKMRFFINGRILLTMIFIIILWAVLQRLMGLNYLAKSDLSVFGIKQIGVSFIPPNNIFSENFLHHSENIASHHIPISLVEDSMKTIWYRGD